MVVTLLTARRFLPLFLVQATGGLNDNLFKTALVLTLVFGAGGASGAGPGAGLTAAAGGLFIAPYALLSATSGQLADRFDKAWLIRANKACEVLLMCFGAWALHAASAPALLAVLLGLGIQATVFGPLKYAILPQHLAPAELVPGNALIEAATFGVILLGTILGGVLIGLPSGTTVVGGLGIALSSLGLVAAWFIPPAPHSDRSDDSAVRVEPNILAATAHVVRAARADADVWRAVLGLSWFWALGATYLAVFPVLVRDLFHADNRVVTLLLAGFALGTGAGALLGGRLLAGTVSFRLLRPAGAALGLCTAAFALLCQLPAAAAWTSPAAILGSPLGLLTLLLLLAAAMAGGIFSLPLNAMIQHRAAPAARSRMIAANNVMNAVFMVAGAGVVAAVSALGCPPGLMLAGAGALTVLLAPRA